MDHFDFQDFIIKMPNKQEMLAALLENERKHSDMFAMMLAEKNYRCLSDSELKACYEKTFNS